MTLKGIVSMPTSQHYQISTIVSLIKDINPRSVLDVGVGFGKYGMLCREYLEFWGGKESYHSFERRIDGVEIFEEYLTPLHRYVYDNVYVGDIGDLVDRLDCKYDIVLLIDVLEHLDKTQGTLLVERLLRKSAGVIISTPKHIGHQKDAFGNPYETHRCQWTKRNLRKLGRTFFCRDATSFIMIVGSKELVGRVRRSNLVRKQARLLLAVPGVSNIYYFLERHQIIRPRKSLWY